MWRVTDICFHILKIWFHHEQNVVSNLGLWIFWFPLHQLRNIFLLLLHSLFKADAIFSLTPLLSLAFSVICNQQAWATITMQMPPLQGCRVPVNAAPACCLNFLATWKFSSLTQKVRGKVPQLFLKQYFSEGKTGRRMSFSKNSMVFAEMFSTKTRTPKWSI